jgi:hypothetical protein
MSLSFEVSVFENREIRDVESYRVVPFPREVTGAWAR